MTSKVVGLNFMANDVHKIKLLVLWDILCKHTDENHAINTDEIIDLLLQRGINASRKTVILVFLPYSFTLLHFTVHFSI